MPSELGPQSAGKKMRAGSRLGAPGPLPAACGQPPVGANGWLDGNLQLARGWLPSGLAGRRNGLHAAWADHEHRRRHLAIAAARLRRLEGAPGVKFAVGQAHYLALAAEVEVRMLGIADRPAARDFRQGLNVFALVDGDLEFLCGRRIRFGITQVEIAQCGVADVGKPRLHKALGRLHAGPRPMRLHARGGGATRQAQPMHLADHGIAGNAAETARNLAGAEAVGPQFFQEFDAFLVPGHALVSPVCTTAEPGATCADSRLLRTSLERRSGTQRSTRTPTARPADDQRETAGDAELGSTDAYCSTARTQRCATYAYLPTDLAIAC